MDTKTANRIEAFRSIQTLRTKHGAAIGQEPTLQSAFDALDDKLKTVDDLLTDIALRGDGHTKDKNTKRNEALTFGAQIGNAVYSMAAKNGKVVLKAQASNWCSTTAIGKGNREVVVARLRALLKTTRDNSRTLVPDYLTDADILALDAKIEAFDQSLKSKSESVNIQVSNGEMLAQTVSAISTLINEELTRSINSFASEFPELVDAYSTARKIRTTVSAVRSKKTVASEPQSEPEINNHDKPAQSDSNPARLASFPSEEGGIASAGAN